jgi:hypothetical protein
MLELFVRSFIVLVLILLAVVLVGISIYAYRDIVGAISQWLERRREKNMERSLNRVDPRGLLGTEVFHPELFQLTEEEQEERGLFLFGNNPRALELYKKDINYEITREERDEFEEIFYEMRDELERSTHKDSKEKLHALYDVFEYLLIENP